MNDNYITVEQARKIAGVLPEHIRRADYRIREQAAKKQVQTTVGYADYGDIKEAKKFWRNQGFKVEQHNNFSLTINWDNK